MIQLQETRSVGFLVIGSDDASGVEYGVIERREVDMRVARAVYDEIFQRLYSETERLQPGFIYKRLRNHPDKPIILGATRVTRSANGREGLKLACAVLSDRAMARVDWNPFGLDHDIWRTIVGSDPSTAWGGGENPIDVVRALECLRRAGGLLEERPDKPLAVVRYAFSRLDTRKYGDVLAFCTAWPTGKAPSQDFGLCYPSSQAVPRISNPAAAWQQAHTVAPSARDTAPQRVHAVAPTPSDAGARRAPETQSDMSQLFWELHAWRAYELAKTLVVRAESGQRLDLEESRTLEHAIDSLESALTRLETGHPATRLPLDELDAFARSARANTTRLAAPRRSPWVVALAVLFVALVVFGAGCWVGLQVGSPTTPAKRVAPSSNQTRPAAPKGD